MFNMKHNRSENRRKLKRDLFRRRQPLNCHLESLEDRTLFSESASAQLNLLSTTGTAPNAVYHYDITVTDTGTTNIGTFWFSWVPGEDFLPSLPTAVSSPTGWSDSITGMNNGTDGSAIEWTATSQLITPGHSLSGYSFSSVDSPTVLSGNSPSHPASPALTATVYSGAAFSDAGFPFVVTAPATTAASTTTLVTSSPNISAGDPVTFTATVVPATGSGADPTGTVSFTQDGNALGTANVLGDGTATISTFALPVGTDHIIATYGGDSAYTGSASAAVTETVTPPINAISTTTTIVPSVSTAVSGTSVTFTATVTPITPGAAPTGTVTFTLNGASLGVIAVASDGTAVLTTSSLPVGQDSVNASYSGDSVYAASSPPAAGVTTITVAPSLVPAITKSTIPAALVAGLAAHGTVTFTVTNETAALVKGKATLAIYAALPGTDSPVLTLLNQVVRQVNLKPTKSVVESLPAKILADTLAAGSYTLLARVIDPSSNTNDSADGPSAVVAQPFVSLSETVTHSTIPTSATASSKAHAAVVLKITNSGNVTTTNTTTVTLFATLSGAIDDTAVQIASVTKPLHIRAGKFVSLNIPIKLIPALAVGDYSVIAQVTDPNGIMTSVAISNLSITG